MAEGRCHFQLVYNLAWKEINSHLGTKWYCIETPPLFFLYLLLMKHKYPLERISLPSRFSFKLESIGYMWNCWHNCHSTKYLNITAWSTSSSQNLGLQPEQLTSHCWWQSAQEERGESVCVCWGRQVKGVCITGSCWWMRPSHPQQNLKTGLTCWAI